MFSYGKWCFDSPGTVSTDQIINLLTAEEISKTLSSSPLRPRTMLLRWQMSILGERERQDGSSTGWPCPAAQSVLYLLGGQKLLLNLLLFLFTLFYDT